MRVRRPQLGSLMWYWLTYLAEPTDQCGICWTPRPRNPLAFPRLG